MATISSCRICGFKTRGFEAMQSVWCYDCTATFGGAVKKAAPACPHKRAEWEATLNALEQLIRAPWAS
jgi:hypothetical protein